jgi:hypothetical protein
MYSVWKGERNLNLPQALIRTIDMHMVVIQTSRHASLTDNVSHDFKIERHEVYMCLISILLFVLFQMPVLCRRMMDHRVD